MAIDPDSPFYTGPPTARPPVRTGWGAPAPPIPGIKTPGYTPNYGAILGNDPGLMAVRNNNTFNLAQAAAERDAQIRKLRYGFSGSRFGSLQQLQRTQDQGNFLGDKSLAARGALHSGETPWEHTQRQYAHDLGLYDASSSLEDQIAQAVHGYLGTAQGAASSEAQGISEAVARDAANPIHQPQEGFANYDVGLSQQYGQHVYKDLSGKYWVIGPDGTTQPFTGGQ
jgi:hypothetical protein